VHPFAFTSSLYDSGTTKIGEMPRNLRLALVQNLYEVANTHLTAIHEVQQPEARRVCESGE
jgi:hypothetical protein